MSRHQSNVPAPTRDRHVTRERMTHEPAGYETPLVSAQPAQQQETQRDSLYGTQNLMEASVTLDKMRLQDEFGSTVLGPSGFTGSWEDTINNGIYNGAFNDNDVSPTGALPAGRTTYVPYWTVALGGTATATSLVGGIQIFLDAAAETFTITSDRIKLRQSMFYQVVVMDRISSTNQIQRTVSINRYARGAFVDNIIIDDYLETAGPEGNPVVRDCGEFPTSFFPDINYGETTEIEIIVKYTWVAGVVATEAVGLYEVVLRPAEHHANFAVSPRIPTDPITGGRYYHQSLQRWFVWTGAQWLSEATYSEIIPYSPVAAYPLTATFSRALRGPIPSLMGCDDIWIDRIEYFAFVNSGGTALSASHKWTATFNKHPAANTNTAIGSTYIIDSGSSAVWRKSDSEGLVSALLNNGTQHYEWSVSWTMTGTPGTLVAYARVWYRLYLAPT